MEQQTEIFGMLEKILAEQAKMSAEQTKTNQRLENLEEGLAKVGSRQLRMEKKMQFISDTVVKIENEHGQKLTSLFDAFSLSGDKDEEHHVRITHLEQRVDRLENDAINLKIAQVK